MEFLAFTVFQIVVKNGPPDPKPDFSRLTNKCPVIRSTVPTSTCEIATGPQVPKDVGMWSLRCLLKSDGLKNGQLFICGELAQHLVWGLKRLLGRFFNNNSKAVNAISSAYIYIYILIAFSLLD